MNLQGPIACNGTCDQEPRPARYSATGRDVFDGPSRRFGESSQPSVLTLPTRGLSLILAEGFYPVPTELDQSPIEVLS